MAALTDRAEKKEASIFYIGVRTVRSFSHSVPRLLGRARVCVGARRGGAAGYARRARRGRARGGRRAPLGPAGGDPIDVLPASPDRTPAHLQLIRVEHALAELGDRAVLAVPLDVLQVVGEEVDVVVAARRRANVSDNIWIHEPEQVSLRRPALVLLDDLDHLLVVCETEIRRRSDGDQTGPGSDGDASSIEYGMKSPRSVRDECEWPRVGYVPMP